MSYAFNSPPKITPTELEPGHGLMPKKQGSAQPDLRDEIARLTAERDDWARKATEWRRKYAELRYPGMTNEVHAHDVPEPKASGGVSRDDVQFLIDYAANKNLPTFTRKTLVRIARALAAGVPERETADTWRQYAKEGETAQACIERHRREQDSLLKLLAQAREPLTDQQIIALLPAGWTGMLAQVMEFARRIERARTAGVPVPQADSDEQSIEPLPQRLAAALVEMAEGKPRGTGSILRKGIDLVEQIAREWDGCEFDVHAVGVVDIGDAIRRSGFAKVNATPGVKSHGWISMAERKPEPGTLIVKRWKSGSVWAGVYSGSDKDSSFDEWVALPDGVKKDGNG